MATGARDLRAAAGRFDSDDHVADHDDRGAYDKQRNGFEHRRMAERRNEHRALGTGCARFAGCAELSRYEPTAGSFTGTVDWHSSLGDTEWHFGRCPTELDAGGSSASASADRSPPSHIAGTTKFGFGNHARERIARQLGRSRSRGTGQRAVQNGRCRVAFFGTTASFEADPESPSE